MRPLAAAAASIAATLLAAELLLRLLPVSGATEMGYYVDPDVLTYPEGHRWSVSTGWDLRNPQSLQANNWGFVSAIDFVPDPKAVALVGDSFVESSMLDAKDRPAAQLQALLGNARPVYAMGSPGTALPDYAARMRLAHDRLGVRDFVVWVGPGSARRGLCGAAFVHARCLDPATLAPRSEHQPPVGRLKQAARHSALLQYVFGQLKFDGARLWQSLWRRQVPQAAPPVAAGTGGQAAADARARQVVDSVVDSFFAEIAPYRQGRLVFLVDDRHGGGAAPDPDRARLVEALRRHGAEVVDLAPAYREHAARSRLSLDVGPYDGHLNALGVAILAREAAAALRAPPPATGSGGGQ